MRRAFFVILVPLLTLQPDGLATTLVPMTFDEVVAMAERAIVGKVSDVRYEHDEETGSVFTFVTLDSVEVIAGQPLDDSKYELRFSGGTVGDYRQEYVGMPTFKVGERVCLFVHKNGTAMCPTVGWTQGCFQVHRLGDREILRDMVGCNVVGYDLSSAQLQYSCPELEADMTPRGGAGVADDGSVSRAVVNPHAGKPPVSLDDFVGIVTTTRARTGFQPEPPPDPARASQWVPHDALEDLEMPPGYEEDGDEEVGQ